MTPKSMSIRNGGLCVQMIAKHEMAYSPSGEGGWRTECSLGCWVVGVPTFQRKLGRRMVEIRRISGDGLVKETDVRKKRANKAKKERNEIKSPLREGGLVKVL